MPKGVAVIVFVVLQVQHFVRPKKMQCREKMCVDCLEVVHLISARSRISTTPGIMIVTFARFKISK